VTDAPHSPAHDSHAADASGHGGGYVSHKKTYIHIFIWLTVLTAIEVGLVFAHLNRFVLITLLCALAIVKAALVAMFFMHLRFERKTLALVVSVPLLLAAILIIGLMPDSQSWFIHR
jgi:cytochrome c oxidase subunit IV